MYVGEEQTDHHTVNLIDINLLTTPFVVYVGEEQAEEEPFLEYLPEHYQIIAPKTGTNGLEASLMLLQESLDSGAALAQFEVTIDSVV